MQTSAPIPIRVAVLGARSARHGVGAHLARHAFDAGATVCAVLGSTARSAQQAADDLARTMPRPAAFDSPDQLWSELAPTLAIIATPPMTHVTLLNSALTSSAHVLCEKPVGWAAENSPDGPDLAGRFLRAGLHLVVHAQWPFTLPTYRTLHPETAPETATRFAMHLAPRTPGLPGLVDSMNHPLSLLAAVCPDPAASLHDIRILAPTPTRTELRFVYRAGGRDIEAAVTLEPLQGPPRPARYAFDGCWAHRVIEPEGYVMALQDDAGRRIPLPDPSRLLVGSLLERIAAGPPDAVDPAIEPGMRHLLALWRVARTVDFQPAP